MGGQLFVEFSLVLIEHFGHHDFDDDELVAPFFVLGSGAPKPRNRNLAPLEVPGGIVKVTLPSLMVGTSTFVPNTASGG